MFACTNGGREPDPASPVSAVQLLEDGSRQIHDGRWRLWQGLQATQAATNHFNPWGRALPIRP